MGIGSEISAASWIDAGSRDGMEIEFQDVSVFYDDLPVLRNIRCQVHSGDLILLTGETGAGKTTFLKLIYGALMPTEGTVLVRSADLQTIPSAQLRRLRQQIGIAFQDVQLLPEWTVEENLLFVLQNRGLSKEAMRHRILEVLSQLRISHVREKFPAELSGGERQLVGVARALVVDPEILLADEPTAHLDLYTMDRLIRVLRQYSGDRVVIIATHHPEMIAAFPQARIFHLQQGALMQLDPQFAG